MNKWLKKYSVYVNKWVYVLTSQCGSLWKQYTASWKNRKYSDLKYVSWCFRAQVARIT